MNTVFSELLRKGTKKATFFIVISCVYMSLTVTKNAQAQKIDDQACASVNFQPFQHKGSSHVAIILAHNHEIQKQLFRQRNEISNGTYKYYLAPGKHSLFVTIHSVKDFAKARNRKAFSQLIISPKADPIKRSVVELTVEHDKAYQLTLVNMRDEQINFQLLEDEHECQPLKQTILTAKPLANDIENLAFKTLPASLEYRLRKLMTKLADFHSENNYEGPFANIIPVDNYGAFGLAVDSNYDDNGKALKVLSVLPYSQASKLNFLSGDKITHLSGDKISSSKKAPNKVVSEYISALHIGSMLNVQVIRNGEKVKLTGRYAPVMLPEVTYQLLSDNTVDKKQPNLLEHTELPVLLKFEYAQLILEIYDYFRDKNAELTTINISRKALIDNRLGVSGNFTVAPEKFGLEVYSIEQESIAEKIGLLNGDIIIKLNGKSLDRNNANVVLASVLKLSQGHVSSVTIKRNNQQLTLKKSYQPTELTAFNLTLDLASKELSDDSVAKIITKVRQNQIICLEGVAADGHYRECSKNNLGFLQK